MRIFSSAENCRRVARRTVVTEGAKNLQEVARDLTSAMGSRFLDVKLVAVNAVKAYS
jgi:hypothetical protein